MAEAKSASQQGKPESGGVEKIDASRFYPKQDDGPVDVPDTVKLISADGFEFIIDRKAAMKSGTIRNMLSSPAQFTEAIHNTIQFPDIKAVILEKVCHYLYYAMINGKSPQDAPEFAIEPEHALEMLMAADYLDT